MKRVALFLLIGLFTITPCMAQKKELAQSVEAQSVHEQNEIKPTIYTFHISDEEETEQENVEEVEQVDIVSDDVTADTSGENIEQEDWNEDEYLVSDLYSDVLKGYASYDEENELDGVELEPEFGILTLNISKPYHIGSYKYTSLKNSDSLYDKIYTKFNGSEYSITPISGSLTTQKIGGFSTGTTYSQGIDFGELEQSSGIFSRYEYKRFAITTSYTKTINTTNHNYNDKFYITPELRLSQYLTLKQDFSADTVKKRKKAEFILSINPFGNRDSDRMRLNFSASETYDEVSNSFWNQIKFSTTFKL